MDRMKHRLVKYGLYAKSHKNLDSHGQGVLTYKFCGKGVQDAKGSKSGKLHLKARGSGE